MASKSGPRLFALLASPRKSPAMADGNRKIEHAGGGFCSPIAQPPSPTSYLVQDKHRREIQEEVDIYEEETSSDDLFDEAENRGSRKTLRELLNFEAGREESLSLLRKNSSSRSKTRCSPARNSTSTPGKSRQQEWQGQCCKDFLLVQAVCGRKHSSRSPRVSSSSRLSSSPRRCSGGAPSPLRNSDQVASSTSIIRSKSSGLNPRARCEINLTKSKSLGAAAYVVRVDSIPKPVQQQHQQQQKRCFSSSTLSPSCSLSMLSSSRSRRKSSVTFTSSTSTSTCVMSSSPSDSMVSAMDRYQQRVKDEHRRQTSSSYLPYKRALLSLFLPLPTFSSQQRTSHHHSSSTVVTFL